MRGGPEPFFVAPGEPLAERLLVISYHFPPGTAVGGLRWQKLAAFAAERGWGLDAITLDPSELATLDEGRLTDLPAGTRVYGVAHPVLWRHRLEDWARRGLRSVAPGSAGAGPQAPERPVSFKSADLHWWPRSLRDLVRARDVFRGYATDARWAAAAASVGAALARERRYLACVTSGPPHMVHEAGRRLRRGSGLPHVMDMRDPWSQVERLVEHVGSPLWYLFARRYERRAVASASLVVMNTEPAAAAMRYAYPEAANRIMAVLNGYDDTAVPVVPRGRTFVIAYAGSVYLDRDPRPLIQATARVIRNRGLKPDDIRIEFLGELEGRSLEDIAAAEGIASFVRQHGPVPRRAAMEFQAAASMLVCLYQDSRLAIPAKVYEYMLFDASMLVFADRDSATADLLARTEAHVVAPDDIAGIEAAIERRYAEHVAGIRPRRLAGDPRFSRRSQAAVLFDAIARVAAGVPAL